jgi:peptide/nickel transport system permease protein
MTATPRRRARFLPGRTIGLYLLTFWVVLTLNFLIPRLMPGDPLLALIDPNSAGFLYDEAVRQEIAAYYGLDRPLIEQYFNYLTQLAQGNLGRSIMLNEPVVDLIAAHLPWTLLLTIPSLLLASLIALVLGTHTGWVRGSWQDRSLLTIFLGLWNMPVFFLGLILLLLFGVHWEIFPISGAVTRFKDYGSRLGWVADVAYHLILPMTALTLSLIGGRFLLMRNTMISVLGQEYMVVARAKGLPERTIKYRHGMRNAMLPFFTLFSVQMGLAVTGSIFIETLFAYPGMGRMMFDAVGTRDYPVLEGAFLIISLSVLLANLAADLLYPRLDPRVQSA